MIAAHTVLMGGGPYSQQLWKNASYHVVSTAQGDSDIPLVCLVTESFHSELNQAKLPMLGLFANNRLAFAIDRDQSSQEPSLAQMTQKALELLRNDKGFVLVVEGSQKLFSKFCSFTNNA